MKNIKNKKYIKKDVILTEMPVQEDIEKQFKSWLKHQKIRSTLSVTFERWNELKYLIIEMKEKSDSDKSEIINLKAENKDLKKRLCEYSMILERLSEEN